MDEHRTEVGVYVYVPTIYRHRVTNTLPQEGIDGILQLSGTCVSYRKCLLTGWQQYCAGT